MFAILLLTAAMAVAAPAALAAPQDPAALLPSDTIFYVGTDSLRASAEAAKASAMHKIFNEDEVQAFLNKPLSILDRVIGEAAKTQGFDEPPFTMSEVVLGQGEGPPIGRFFIALAHVNFEEAGGDQAAMANAAGMDVGFVVGVELLGERDMKLVKGMWDMIPVEQTETSLAGHTIFTKMEPSEAMGAHMAILDKMAVISLSSSAIEDVITRYEGQGGASLADSAGYQKMMKLAGGMKAGGSAMYARPPALADLLRQGAAMAMMMEGEAEMIPAVTGLIDSLGLEAFEGLGSVSYRDREGLVHGTSVVYRNPQGKGLLPELVGDLQPLDLSQLDKIPADAMSANGAALPELAVVYDFAMNTLEMFEEGAADEVRAKISEVMPEDEFRSNLLENLGGEWWAFALPNQGVMQMPANVHRVQAKDPSAFIDALTKITAFASKEMGVDVGVVKSTKEGPEIYELDLSKTPLAMAMMAPGFAVDGNDLVFSPESADLVRKMLEGSVGEGQLSAEPEFAAFVSRLKGKGELVGIAYVDNAETFSAMYGQMTGTVQLLGGSAGDLPVDLSMLPTEDSIRQHLGHSYAGEYRTEDGRQIVAESLSQFDLGDFLPFALMGAMFATMGETTDFSEVAREKDPRDQALDDMGKIKAGLTIFRIANKRYPESLAELVEPHPDYPNGFMGTLELPSDPWGNGYHYRLDGKKPVLWSAGPNGSDDNGEGDDVVMAKRA